MDINRAAQYEADPPQLMKSRFPTCNYDACENVPYRAYKDALVVGGGEVVSRWFKWVLTFVIGVGTAMVAYGIDVVVHQLEKHKNDWVTQRFDDCGGCLDEPYAVLTATNFGYVLVAAILVFFVPAAAGSGIPEIKCYLNGLRLPGILSFGTLVSKACGVLMSVSGGLPCGKEGPMIHSGAIVASGVSQGILPIFKEWQQSETLQRVFLPFRDDKNKRDFVSCGAAAGVAAAFGAPVGGVLFALEEGCSFWDPELTWRMFFCSITCAFSMAFFTGTGTGERSLNAPGMIDFGDFSDGRQVPFDSVEIIWFILIGACGGLLGALFNAINLKITDWRSKRDDYLTQRGFSSSGVRGVKIIEAVLMSFLVSSTAFFCIGGMPTVCGRVPSDDSASSDGTNVNDILVGMKCGEKQYNPQATLWLNSASEDLKLLFHFPGEFDEGSLLLAGVCYFVLMVINYGVAVPSGLFVPSLMTGALFGRVAGELVKKIPYHTFEKVDPGTYALIGAASFLAGVCRITFSLTVILIEATRDIAYGLPLMICIMTAKLVGDAINKGIYDMHIEYRELPFLEATIRPSLVRRTTVAHFMTRKESLVTFNPVESVSRVVDVLRTRAFCGFPICHDDHTRFGTEHAGLMTRSRLMVLLYKRVFVSERKVYVVRGSLGNQSADEVRLAEFMDRNNLERVKGVTKTARSAAGDTIRVEINSIEGELSLPYNIIHDAPFNDFISWDEFNFPKVDYKLLQGHAGMRLIEDSLQEGDYDKLIDLRPYMNPQPFLVPDNFSYDRCYRLFRSVGLRHMLVVDSTHAICGIITRHDVWQMYHYLEHPPTGWSNIDGVLVKDGPVTLSGSESETGSTISFANEGGSHWDGETSGAAERSAFNPF